jgi:hypothetical protein
MLFAPLCNHLTAFAPELAMRLDLLLADPATATLND